MYQAVVILVIVAGCGDKDLARLEAIRDEVCACTSPECGEAAMKQVPEHEIESNHRTQRVARAMLDCLHKLYEAGRPTTDPDAEAPEPSGPGIAAPASAKMP